MGRKDENVIEHDTSGCNIFADVGIDYKEESSGSIFDELMNMKNTETEEDEKFIEEHTEKNTNDKGTCLDTKESVSDSCIQKVNVSKNKANINIKGYILKIVYDNGGVYNSRYSNQNFSHAIEDLYNEAGSKELSIRYQCDGDIDEKVTEIIYMSDDNCLVPIEPDLNLPMELKFKIMDDCVKAASKLMKLQNRDLNLLSDDDKQKIVNVKKKRINNKKYISKKKTELENVFINEDFTGMDFSGMDFSGFTFKSCTLEKTNFTGCNFIETKFIDSSLKDAETERAAFEGAEYYQRV